MPTVFLARLISMSAWCSLSLPLLRFLISSPRTSLSKTLRVSGVGYFLRRYKGVLHFISFITVLNSGNNRKTNCCNWFTRAVRSLTCLSRELFSLRKYAASPSGMTMLNARPHRMISAITRGSLSSVFNGELSFISFTFFVCMGLTCTILTGFFIR